MKARLFIYALVFCAFFGLDKIAWALVLVWGIAFVESLVVAIRVTRDHRARSGRARLAVAIAIALLSFARCVDSTRPAAVERRADESQSAFLARAQKELFR